MKRIIASILGLVGLLTAPAAFAQSATTPYGSPNYYASSFNLWSIPQTLPNSYTFAGRGVCNSSAQNLPFFVFNTNAPVYIADSNTANSEVLTPSAIVNNAGSCGITISPTHSHYTFQVRSGTAGLQESFNALQSNGAYPAIVLLDRNWWVQAAAVPGTTPAAMLTAAVGNASVLFEDITTAPATYYVPSSTSGAYTSGTWTGTKPTAAAGAGAGTSPTISDAGTALAGTVSLTTGTATTTGALFTLTYANTGQFLYAPVCKVKSVGTNVYSTFTVATTYPGGPHALVTVTVATTAPVASTAYSFSYQCQ